MSDQQEQQDPGRELAAGWILGGSGPQAAQPVEVTCSGGLQLPTLGASNG